MSKIEIFEAAGCCATSSVVVSDEAVKWNASAEWAKKSGVDIGVSLEFGNYPTLSVLSLTGDFVPLSEAP